MGCKSPYRDAIRWPAADPEGCDQVVEAREVVGHVCAADDGQLGETAVCLEAAGGGDSSVSVIRTLSFSVSVSLAL